MKKTKKKKCKDLCRKIHFFGAPISKHLGMSHSFIPALIYGLKVSLVTIEKGKC